MADEDTTTDVIDETSSQLDFTDEELAALDGDPEDGTASEAEEDPEGEEGEEGEDTEEEEEEAEDEGDLEGGEGEEDGKEGEEGKEGKEEEEEEPEPEVFELEVKGQKHTVEGIDDLAALAQKGIFFEAECNQMREQVKSASFTMNAMVKDPLGFYEAYCTQKNGGNYDAARAECYRIADAYMKPILEEIGADEAGRTKLRQAREDKLSAQKEREEYQEKSFTHEDMEWIRIAQHNVGVALAEAGLPEDSSRMRKRMADIMLEQHRGGSDVHPQQAAQMLREELEALGAEVASPPGKDGKKTRTKEEKQAAIKRARAKKSRKKTGLGREGAPRGEVRTINSRQFLDGIDKALNLDRY